MGLSSSCAEYFIPDVTHKNLFLKFNITSSGTKEVLVSYVEKENGIDKIFYLGYKENVNVIIPGAVDELTASDISQIAKIALAEGKLPGLLSKLGHTPNLYRVINALDESIVEHAALIQKIDGLVSEPNKIAQLETLAGDDLYASVSSSYNKASYFADVVAGTGKFTKYPKVYFWLKAITDASARANVDNIITNWSDDLLKKLNYALEFQIL